MEEVDIREVGRTLLKPEANGSSDKILFRNNCKTQHTGTQNNGKKKIKPGAITK